MADAPQRRPGQNRLGHRTPLCRLVRSDRLTVSLVPEGTTTTDPLPLCGGVRVHRNQTLLGAFYLSLRHRCEQPCDQAPRRGVEVEVASDNGTHSAQELAVLYVTTTEWANAIEMFEQLAKADKTKAAFAFEQIATLEALNGNIKKAIEWNNKVFAAGGVTPDRLFRQGKLYAKDKQLNKAIECMKKAIAGRSAKKKSVDAYQLELIGTYKLADRTQDAIKLAEHLVKTTKSDRTRRQAKAQLALLKGKNAPKKDEKK